MLGVLYGPHPIAASSTIRKRILKLIVSYVRQCSTCRKLYDPQEDTETSARVRIMGLTAYRKLYDPQEDTETLLGCGGRGGEWAASSTIRKRILKLF